MLDLSSKNFDSSVLSSSFPVVVMFFADWCSKCSMMKPMVLELEKKYKHRILFFTVNVDQSPELASNYSSDVVPTFVFFKNGQILAYFSGIIDENVFEQRLKKIFRNC